MLYHKDVFLPRRISKSLPKNLRTLVYSNHAISESKKDKYGKFDLPYQILFNEWELIEAELTSDSVTKIVIRKPIDNDRSLCLAVIPSNNLVKTVWINLNSDTHKTLNKNIYVKRPS